MSQRDPDLKGKSLLIFDDGLRSLAGHWYDYDKAIVDVHRSHGVQVTLVCNAEFDQAAAMAAAGAEVLPIIRRSVWTGHAPPRRGFREFGSLLRQALYFATLLDRQLASRHYDLVFVPNAMAYDSLAWLILWWKNRFRGAGRVVLLFRFAVRHHPAYAGSDPDMPGGLPRRIRLWGRIVRGLSGAARSGRIGYLTDSLRLATEYRSALGIDLSIAPSPRALPARAMKSMADVSAPMTFALLGYARWARGTDLFDKAVENLLERPEAKGLRFVFQWYSDVIDPHGVLCSPSPTVAASPHVEILAEPLSTQEYEAMFSRIDCMVLPYRRSYYYSQISGVAIEAACAGIPMIVTGDTWLSDFVADQGAGLTVPDDDAAALAAAILAIAAKRERFAREARRAGERARALNTPEAFMRQLWRSDDGCAKGGVSPIDRATASEDMA